jgi:hypothetical protein
MEDWQFRHFFPEKPNSGKTSPFTLTQGEKVAILLLIMDFHDLFSSAADKRAVLFCFLSVLAIFQKELTISVP